MKKIVLILLIASNLFTQEKVTKVEYEWYNNLNKENKSRKTYLHFNKNKSIYKCFLGDRKYTVKTKLKGFISLFAGDATIVRTINDDKDKTEIYVLIDNNTYIERKPLSLSSKYYTIKDKYITPKWELLDSVTIVNNYKCNLAKTNYYGREYYAWYTKDIKSDKGPWKLKGLSGLIIYAYTNDNKVSWKISNINKNSEYNFGLNSNDSYISYDDFLKKEYLLKEKRKAEDREDTTNEKKEFKKEDIEKIFSDDMYNMEILEKSLTPY